VEEPGLGRNRKRPVRPESECQPFHESESQGEFDGRFRLPENVWAGLAKVFFQTLFANGQNLLALDVAGLAQACFLSSLDLNMNNMQPQ
jgi:hypothetical protein